MNLGQSVVHRVDDTVGGSGRAGNCVDGGGLLLYDGLRDGHDGGIADAHTFFYLLSLNHFKIYNILPQST